MVENFINPGILRSETTDQVPQYINSIMWNMYNMERVCAALYYTVGKSIFI